MNFRALQIENWRQFAHVEINFHNNLTILTGANGAGKTTILNILGQHYNWNLNFVSTPWRSEEGGTIQYLSDLFKYLVRPGGEVTIFQRLGEPGQIETFGHIVYDNGRTAQLQVPVQVNQQYGVMIPHQQQVEGLHIPSHRPIYSYQPVNMIPTQAISRKRLYNEYFNSFFQRFMGGHTAKAPNQVMKEALISQAIFGAGNTYVTPDDDARAAFEGFQEVLRKVLPPKIGFRRIAIRVPEVVLETDSGDFSIDAVSGGVSSILDMAWRIFMYSPEGKRFVCTIDEPENHLHPELQQSLLPNLIKAFPNVQFIIATHNPFMISAVYDSSVYVLDYGEMRKVISKQLEIVNKAGTANEILRDVLGLPFTLPLWAEEKLQLIVNKYAERGVSEETVNELEAELKAAGLDAVIPEQTITSSSDAEQ